MTNRALTIASIVGLVFAAIAAALLNRTAETQWIDLTVLALDTVAAGIAGRVILGVHPVHRYFRLTIVVFSAIAAAFFTTALTNYFISQQASFGTPSAIPNGSVIVTAVGGLVVWLIAATIYGFAGTRQSVRAGARVGLLFLLLAAALPGVAVLGLLGLVVTTFTRKPAIPVPPAASA